MPKIVGPLGGQLHVRTLYDMIIDYVLELPSNIDRQKLPHRTSRPGYFRIFH